MAEQPMETTLRTALWQQFGAVIDMLENALVACPDTLWQEHLWIDSEGPEGGTFWNITYHTLYWLDLYLTGRPVEEFTPPAPFRKRSDDVIPKQPYTRDELHTYLVHLRKKCQSTITELSDEKGHQPFHFPWDRENPISYLELQLYTMRHMQEHAAQLSLFLGQHPSQTRRSTGSGERRMKRASEARVGVVVGPTRAFGWYWHAYAKVVIPPQSGIRKRPGQMIWAFFVWLCYYVPWSGLGASAAITSII